MNQRGLHDYHILKLSFFIFIRTAVLQIQQGGNFEALLENLFYLKSFFLKFWVNIL